MSWLCADSSFLLKFRFLGYNLEVLFLIAFHLTHCTLKYLNVAVDQIVITRTKTGRASIKFLENQSENRFLICIVFRWLVKCKLVMRFCSLTSYDLYPVPLCASFFMLRHKLPKDQLIKSSEQLVLQQFLNMFYCSPDDSIVESG